MKNETYLYFANAAIQKEKEEKYDLAATYWKRAKYLAADLKHRLWAQYNQENNKERHLLHHSHITVLSRYMNKQAANDD
ncbi:hypothetical protein KKJ01_07235 [Xenorhabdus bovienii]|uniref:ANR family transcriptional regulator n=1 Tax=Xenorhabdus bovienii TaxID=40576 RepID=A0AAJ1J757_XENBV|nr:hypothetical protein [Xenorhabdus bovienii]MDE1478041.1 hypothetical protein [Xenorhabdus bovienii]MDE9509716.1 hypothetical protein [Xenorhabdus bovienii]MDE9521359.1 hypothetical protein [Xenorhabdus bovienii]